MTPIWHGITKDGRLIVADRANFEAHLRSLNGCEIEISVRKRRHQRSLSANNYYWGIVIKMISDYSGHTPEETHSALKQKFLIDRSDPAWPRVKSTTELSVSEFSAYCERCIALAGEFGSLIPSPGAVEV